MGGQVLFQDALAARLELIKPSKADVEACLKKHPLRLTKGLQKVVEILHARGTPVYLVSGGFRQVKESSINDPIMINVPFTSHSNFTSY
jgi:phosphoserine phosphatase